MKLRCDNIIATDATQVRVKLDKDLIEQYAADIKNGDIFPAVDVFAENGSEAYWLADGFHRHRATIDAGKDSIKVKLHEGGKHDALIHALGANAGHGLRRTNADKINAVKLALKDPAICQLTQQEIADICRVDRSTVQRVERRGLLNENDSQEAAKPHESGTPEENSPDNVRPTKVPPTQKEIDLAQVRELNAGYKEFPYDGDGFLELELTPDDIADFEYVSTMTAHAVIAYRNRGDD